MIKKITLTKVFTTGIDKAGNQLISKQGKPYTKMLLKAQEYGDKWLSGFKNKETENFKEGDTVEVDIAENGIYLNFSVPKAEAKIHSIEDKLIAMHSMLISMNFQILNIAEKTGAKIFNGNTKIGTTDVDYPEDDINAEDIPF